MANQAKALRMKRVSSTPNKFKSYAYELDMTDAKTREYVEKAEENKLEGIYNPREGVYLLFSPSRIGKLEQNINIPIREAEGAAGSKSEGRTFINLIDSSNEQMGEIGSKVQLASRFGGAFESAVANVGAQLVFGTLAVAQPAVAQPATAQSAINEQPAQNKQLVESGQEEE